MYSYDRLLIKGTLFGEKSNLSAVYGLSLEGFFLKIHISDSPHMLYELCKFGCDWSLIKGT
jgi:hypothetical protein